MTEILPRRSNIVFQINCHDDVILSFFFLHFFPCMSECPCWYNLLSLTFFFPFCLVNLNTFWTFYISVDNTPPVIDCPEDVSLVVEIGTGGATATWIDPVATDLSGMATVSCDFVQGMFFPTGETTVTCIARDNSNNVASCTFIVIVAEGKSRAAFYLRMMLLFTHAVNLLYISVWYINMFQR